jgi:hypothetical protein
MKHKQILEEIAKHGSCEHIKLADCKRCPLAKIKKRPKWNAWLSCYDSICGDESLTEEQQAERYKRKASEMLADIEIEEALRDK